MNALVIIPILLGFLAGMLINYLADVLPDTLRLTRPVCANPECKHPFSWTDYLVMRRCTTCGKRRGPRPIIVLVLAILASVYIWLVPPAQLGYTLGFIVLAYLLMVAVIDLEYHLILRPLSIAGIVLAFLAGFIAHGWLSTLIGGAVGFGIMFLFYLFGRLFTRMHLRRMGRESEDSEEALGSGDVTVATILGLLLGWPLIWFSLLLGVLLAGIISLFIIVGLLLSGRYGQKALMVFIPYGSVFVLCAILLIYFPHWMAYLVPG
jgi:prepilin signal peptidase PulO-like enzyme (type II secretory pathway)